MLTNTPEAVPAQPYCRPQNNAARTLEVTHLSGTSAQRPPDDTVHEVTSDNNLGSDTRTAERRAGSDNRLSCQTVSRRTVRITYMSPQAEAISRRLATRPTPPQCQRRMQPAQRAHIERINASWQQAIHNHMPARTPAHAHTHATTSLAEEQHADPMALLHNPPSGVRRNSEWTAT